MRVPTEYSTRMTPLKLPGLMASLPQQVHKQSKCNRVPTEYSVDGEIVRTVLVSLPPFLCRQELSSPLFFSENKFRRHTKGGRDTHIFVYSYTFTHPLAPALLIHSRAFYNLIPQQGINKLSRSVFS